MKKCLNKYIKLLNIILLCIFSTIGCGDAKQNNDMAVEIEFIKDGKTIRHDEVWQSAMKDDENNNSYDVSDPSIHFGEINLENSDTSRLYEIAGNDIVYNGVIYKDLYYNVQHLQLPCDMNTFINFIIKTYSTTSDKVLTYYVNDTEIDETLSEDIGAAISIDEELRDNKLYIELTEKYNDIAKWSLSLYDEDSLGSSGILYGCESFLLYNGGSGVQSIDMSKYDFTLGKEANTVEYTEELIIENGDIESESNEEN
ncbi:MAG: hypothetical protein J6A59_12580 [Lachnospiraceae bacterium]|nr:hypothetical protein [Lachnospiraceae bacterium]